MTIRLVEPQSESHWAQARQLLDEYVASLNMDLSFQNIANELENFSSEYASPKGAFLLAKENGVYVGCVGLRPFSKRIGEIKRLYVRPLVRGHGVGRFLIHGIIAVAKQRGYTRLFLDTLPFMREAQSLYVSLGFKPTEPYRYNPVSGATFLELAL